MLSADAITKRIVAYTVGLISHIYKLRLPIDIRVNGDSLHPESIWSFGYLLAVRMMRQAISPLLAIKILRMSL